MQEYSVVLPKMRFSKQKGLIILFSLIGIVCMSLYYYSRVHTSMYYAPTMIPWKPKIIQNITKLTADGAWTINSMGRLGNQMGKYATLYALTKLNGHPAYIMPDMYNWLAPIFKIRLPQLHHTAVKEIKWERYSLHGWMSEEYKHIEGKYVHFSGYPWSWTFYHHIRDEILREFTFHDFIKEEANAYLEKLKGSRKNVTYIGVHVRRGDYMKHIAKSKGLVADKGYLDKAMAYFRNKYEEPVFVVTSNGMQWCKENINNSRGDVYFSGDSNESSPGKDFSYLVHCNHTIMTLGTFGFWAGYLAGGEVVYLDNYTLPTSRFFKLFHYDAMFLPEWIGIPADLSPLQLPSHE